MEGPQRGHRLGIRGAAERRQARHRNLVEVLSVVRDVTPEEIESEFEGSGYGDFKAAVADAVVDYLAPVRERYEELRADRTALETALAQGAEGAGDRVRHARGRARRDGGRGAVGAASTAATVTPVPVADLDLELDVFAGPFDLLMAVVLQGGRERGGRAGQEWWSPTSSTSRSATSWTSRRPPSSSS